MDNQNQYVRNFCAVKSIIKNSWAKFGLEKEIYKIPEIIVVTKTQNEEKIIPILESGHRIYGENKVQEAAIKWVGLRDKFSDIELHMIGALQTNKVKEALRLFDVIQTIDRKKLADEVAKQITVNENIENIRTEEFFIQVNTGKEEQKAGITPEDADEFIKYCKDKGLNITGLMCIPPVNGEASLHFALLKRIASRNGIEKLSMGMSGDFEIAAAMGATYVRIGSAIFGERQNKPKNSSENIIYT